MTLRTKLILAATGLTFAVVLAVSGMFLAELLRDRIAQTAAANGALASQVVSAARRAIEAGVKAHPPESDAPDAVHDAVVDWLRSSDALRTQMDATVRYSPTVQDVLITDTHGIVILSTDATAVDQQAPERTRFDDLMAKSIVAQTRTLLFGRPEVLDIARSLDLDRQPLIFVHIGIRSTFVSNNYAPWLRGMMVVILFSLFAAALAAAVLASLALRPLGGIVQQLDALTAGGVSEPLELGDGRKDDAIVRVSQGLDVLGRKMRSSAEEASALRSNLNQVLDTLRDCVVLFGADRRALLVSESTAELLGRPLEQIVQRPVEEIFQPGTVLGDAIAVAYRRSFWTREEKLTLEDGRRVSFSLEWIAGAAGQGKDFGALLTLRDVESVEQFGREIDVSQRLAAIGRLTAGVGHEVKNPINSMVLHLELLKSKLEGAGNGASRHLEVLTNEMARLDRVVQTLADFSRPVELQMAEQDLRGAIRAVLNLAAVELEEARIVVEMDEPARPVMVMIDAELIRQALLNVVLNAQQAIVASEGVGEGKIAVRLRVEGEMAVLTLRDDGPGIPADVLPSIFNLYFTTKPKGSGIGLAMVYRILQMHGGTVEATSVTEGEGRGTTFTVRVPLARTLRGQKAVAEQMLL